jgi:hypothetical protein
MTAAAAEHSSSLSTGMLQQHRVQVASESHTGSQQDRWNVTFQLPMYFSR